jgi:hypothetical protein
METPSTERIRELSERLDSLRGELVSERTKNKEAAPPAVVPAAAPARPPMAVVAEPIPPPHVLATSSASQQQIDLLSNQLASLRSELSATKPPAMGMPASYSAAYAANAPPAAVPTQAGLVTPEDFHSPTKTHVHNVHDTLCRVQDAFTNERRINDEVANSKLLVVDNLISQTAALRLKKITEIREKADDFVHELNRMREEDKVREMVYADLFFQTKTALQSAIQEEEDARKLLEQALQLQISDMMDAIKVEIDRDNRERERSEEARREKFQRDALKIRETLDDDRQNRIEAAATLSHAAEDQFADLQYSTDNERQDLKDLDTRLTTEIQSRLTAIELELQQEVEDRTYVQDKREDLVKEGLQLIKEKLTNEQNHRGLSYDRILKKIDLDISQTSANIRSQTMMRESSEASLIHVMENLAVQVKEELKTEKVERKKTDVGLIRVLEDTFTVYN